LNKLFRLAKEFQRLLVTKRRRLSGN